MCPLVLEVESALASPVPRPPRARARVGALAQPLSPGIARFSPASAALSLISDAPGSKNLKHCADCAPSKAKRKLARMVAGTRISARNLTGRYMPARISPHSRWRFIRDRRAALLRRIGGAPPDERQALTISMLIDAEWALTVAQHDAEAAPDMRTRTESMRLAADARKQILLWNRELVAATPQPSAATPPDPMTKLRDHLARRQGEAA